MTFDRFDRFEAYTNHTLPDKEREQMEQELALDSALRDELADYQRFRYDLESIALKEQLVLIHDQLEQQGELEPVVTPIPTGRVRRLWPAWVAAAMVVLIAGFALYGYLYLSLSKTLFTTYYIPEPVSRGETDCGPELTPSIQAYRQANYQAALAEVEKLSASQPCVRYYRGLIQLALGNASDAIMELEQVVSKPPTEPEITFQKAEWYLAMAYLSADKPEKAHQQLEKIASQINQPFQHKAQEVLRDLDTP